jgi:integrase
MSEAQKQSRGRRGLGGLYPVTINGVKYWQRTKSFTYVDELTGEKKRRRVTGTAVTKAGAEARLLEKLMVKSGRTVEPVTAPQVTQLLYRDWFYQWLDGIPPQKITDIVRRGYRRRGEMYLLPFIGDTPVEEMETEDLRRLFEFTLPNLQNDKGKLILSEATLLNIFRVLQMSLTAATRRKAINIVISPLAGVSAPERDKTKQSLGAAIGMSLGLIKWLNETNHPDECRFLLQYMGLRRSERLGLEWEDVKYLNNASRAYIRVSQQIARYDNGDGWYLKRPKTKSSTREIPLVEPFLSALREWKKQQDKLKLSPEWNPEPAFANLVFLKPTGEIIVPNRDNEDWHTLLTSYGIAEKSHWRGHLNRHITATLLAQNGVSVAVAQTILGHASEAMTYYYTSITKSSMVGPLKGYGNALTERVKKLD